MNPNPSDTRRSGAASTTRAGDTIVIAPFLFFISPFPFPSPSFLFFLPGSLYQAALHIIRQYPSCTFTILRQRHLFLVSIPSCHTGALIYHSEPSTILPVRGVCVWPVAERPRYSFFHKALAHSEAASIPMMGCGDESDSALVAQFFRFPLCTYEHNAKKKRLSVE